MTIKSNFDKDVFDMTETDITEVLSIITENRDFKTEYKEIEKNYKKILYHKAVLGCMRNAAQLLYQLKNGSISVYIKPGESYLSSTPDLNINITPIKNDESVPDDIFYTECINLLKKEIDKLNK